MANEPKTKTAKRERLDKQEKIRVEVIHTVHRDGKRFDAGTVMSLPLSTAEKLGKLGRVKQASPGATLSEGEKHPEVANLPGMGEVT